MKHVKHLSLSLMILTLFLGISLSPSSYGTGTTSGTLTVSATSLTSFPMNGGCTTRERFLYSYNSTPTYVGHCAFCSNQLFGLMKSDGAGAPGVSCAQMANPGRILIPLPVAGTANGGSPQQEMSDEGEVM